MADDVKKSEILSEQAGEAGAEPKERTDTPKSADPGSVRKKKRVRKKPVSGESETGGTQDVHQEDSDDKGEKIRRKRKKPVVSKDAKTEEGAERKKKKVHIKKADAHLESGQKEETKDAAPDTTEAEAAAEEKAEVKPAAEEKAEVKPAAEEKSAEGSGKKKRPKLKKKPSETAEGEKAPTKRKVKKKAAKDVSEGTDSPSGKDALSGKDSPAGKDAPSGKDISYKERFKKFLVAAKNAGMKLIGKIPEKSRKRVLIGAGAVLGVYLLFVIVFSFIFMPRTYLNGTKVSLKSYASSSKLLTPLIDDYALTIHNLDGSQDKVEGSSVHLQYESMKWIKKALRSQNQFAWPASFFRKNEITIEEDVSFDTNRFEQILDKLSGFRTTTMIEPQDAHVAMDETGNYVVYTEVLGTTIDLKAAKEAARECLLTNNPTLTLEEFHILPKVYSTDERLAERLREWNEYMKSVGLTYIFWDTPEVLTREIINDLISDGGEKLYVDKDKVMHLMAVWADRHDSLGRPFTFTTYDGYQVEIAAGGDYGYELNEEAVAEDLINKLNAHDTGSYEVSYWRKPLFTTNNGLGDTYIEVSISDQHMWMYNEGQLVIDTPVVTGRPTDAGDRITHKGCYSVDWHDTNVTLGTYETRGYEQHVKYWIAFNQSEGIHDAKWREDAEFGGDTYLYNGSHGCVNTPISAMAVVYDMVIDGEAVVVY